MLLAAVGGAATGLAGGAFRRLLVEADTLRGELLRWATAGQPARVLVTMLLLGGLAAACALPGRSAALVACYVLQQLA